MTIVVNMRYSEYDVKVDRTTPYGNPFIIGPDGDRETVVHKNKVWLETGKNFGNVKATEAKRQWILLHVKELYGLRIGCHCAPKSCHAYTLADVANQHYGGLNESR